MPPKAVLKGTEEEENVAALKVYGTMDMLAEFKQTIIGLYIKKEWNNISWQT